MLLRRKVLDSNFGPQVIFDGNLTLEGSGGLPFIHPFITCTHVPSEGRQATRHSSAVNLDHAGSGDFALHFILTAERSCLIFQLV